MNRMRFLRRFKRPVVALAATILLLLPTVAQEANRQVLRQRTSAEIEKIIAEVDGVVGLAVEDLTTGEQFLVNENLAFPQGSSIKIPILLEVMKQAAEGKFKLSDQRWVEKKHLVGGSGVLKEFGDHTSALSIRDLATLMIVLSDNTATNMLIDLVGMENVDKTLAGLGLKQTRLQRKMIDQAASARGDENISTPAEALRLMKMLYRGEAADRRICDEVIAVLKKPKQGNLARFLPSGVEIANKPGGIEGVACEWGIVYLPRQPYIIVVMSNYGLGDSAPQAIAKISKVIYDYFWRLSLSTPYGTRVPAALLEKRP